MFPTRIYNIDEEETKHFHTRRAIQFPGIVLG